MMPYRAKEYRLLDKEKRKTYVIYTPQVFFNGDWCHFGDALTNSGLIECESLDSAFKKAQELYNDNRDVVNNND